VPSGLYQILQEDLKAQSAPKANALTMLSYLRRPGFSAVFLYRLSAACVKRGVFGKTMSRVFARINLWFNGCEIYPEAVIGPGFLIGHSVGVVIGMATIGRNFRIQQNTTLGVRNFTDDEHNPVSYPVVGDDVTICVGAAVLGGITIGNGAMIGANAVVLEDVPDNCVAVGVPARILEKRKAQAS
jgi:serine O-acetyltransferase